MRGEKVDESLVLDRGREIDLVDQAGRAPLLMSGRADANPSPPQAKPVMRRRSGAAKRKPRQPCGEALSRSKSSLATSKSPNLVAISTGCSARMIARPLSAARLARST